MSKGLTDAKFIIDFQEQRHWDWKVAFYLYGAGTSAGLIFLELVLRDLGVVDERVALWGMWIGLVLLFFFFCAGAPFPPPRAWSALGLFLRLPKTPHQFDRPRVYYRHSAGLSSHYG